MRKLEGDIRSIGLLDRSVGAIWCSAVLLHLDEVDVARSLREFHRVLREDGLLQIAVKAGTGRCTETFPGSPYRRHFFYYRTEDVLRLAEEAGFDVKETWTEHEDGGELRSVRWLKALLKPRDR